MITGARANFCASHCLPQHEGLHGHSYEVWVYARGDLDAEALQLRLREVCSYLDHKMLNAVINPPTMEKIVEFIRAEMYSTGHIGGRLEIVKVVVLRPVEGLCAEWNKK